METIIQGGTIINEGRAFRGDIVLEDDHIAALYEAEKAPRGIYQQTVDASGCFVFPGIIDAHVHFREPGLTRKADIESESRAAQHLTSDHNSRGLAGENEYCQP